MSGYPIVRSAKCPGAKCPKRQMSGAICLPSETIGSHAFLKVFKAKIVTCASHDSNMSDGKQFTLMATPGVPKQTAMELANQDLREVKKDHQSGRKIPFTRTDRVTLYLELADVYRTHGQSKEAGKVMQDAMAEFKGSPEEIRLAVANADLALDRCDQ